MRELLSRKIGELLELLVLDFDYRKRPEETLGNFRASYRLRQREDVLLESWGQPDKHEYLYDPGAGYAFPAGDVGLAGDLPGA